MVWVTMLIALRRAGWLVLASSLGCGGNIVEAPDKDEIGESAESSTGTGESGESDSDSGSSDSGSSDSSSTEPADADWGTETDPSTSSESTSGDTTESTTDEPTTEEGPADCTSNADCALGNCLEGACVQVESCRQLAELDEGDTLADGVYAIDPDTDGPTPPFDAYCDMTFDGGGWTLVLKSDGNANTFAYESMQWGSTTAFQPQFPDLDHNEAKLASYASVAFDELLVGIEAPPSVEDVPLLEWLVVPIAGDSLHALIQPGAYIPSMLGRDAWKALVSGSSLQLNCNREGLNTQSSQNLAHHRVRIGIVANEQNDCNSPNSRLGIGGAGEICGTLPNPTGNFAGCSPDNGDINLVGFGVVLVR